MLDRDREDVDGWTSAAASGFALAGFLALVFVAFTLLAVGPFMKYDAYFNLAPPPEDLVPFLMVLDRVGQRAVALPVLGLALYLIYRRHPSWRPLVLAGASVFTLNLVVLLLKLGLGRSAPYTADPSFFMGGMAYPSGHSANIVLVYGLAAYLLSHYGDVTRRAQGLMWGGVAVLAVTMVVTSLTLNWHWFADLVAGLLVGGIVLELTVAVDRLMPAHVLAAGGREGLREAVVTVLRVIGVHRPQGPTGTA
ncbi:MAG TPA: phosphatase PAP2 family protein [Nocardioidaceae bacterium]